MSEQRRRSPVEQSRQAFYREARAAISDGLLTVEERDVIARPRHRKAGYWSRHLEDLRGILEQRRAEKAKA